MTIVLDTNVLISGVFWSGAPSVILKKWQAKEFKIAVSLEIIEECRRVGQELGKKYPAVNISSIIDLIAFNSEIYAVEP